MRIGVIGARAEITGYELAGATLFPADDPPAVRLAWQRLPADVGIVILTADAARTLEDRTALPGVPMIAVMPQ